MKIVSWNCCCNGGFNEKKINAIQEYQPDVDIFVIQECTYFECIGLESRFKNFAWYGDGKDSMLGIGLFSNKYQFKLSNEYRYDAAFRYVVPYIVSGEGKTFTLFAVWTKNYIINDGLHTLSYVENIHKAVEVYQSLLEKPVILIGDFNSGDTPSKRAPCHVQLVEKLKKQGIVNCAPNERQVEPTFFQNNDIERPFTDDYCFASKDLLGKVSDFEIGNREQWKQYSDHLPIVVTFNW
jgi:exonuclease III